MIQYYIKTETTAFYPIAIRGNNNKLHITSPIVKLLKEDTLVYNTDNSSNEAAISISYFINNYIH